MYKYIQISDDIIDIFQEILVDKNGIYVKPFKIAEMNLGFLKYASE